MNKFAKGAEVFFFLPTKCIKGHFHIYFLKKNNARFYFVNLIK